MRLPPSLPRLYTTTAAVRPRVPPLTLSHFLLRQRVLSLYRSIIRACRRLPPSTRDEMRLYAREEFEQRRNEGDLRTIRYLLSTGKAEFERVGRLVGGVG